MVLLSSLLLGVFTYAGVQVVAHPGHDVAVEVAERQAYFNSKHAKRSLAHCAEHFAKRGMNSKALKRRAAVVAELREKVALKKRHALAKRATSTTTSSRTATSSGMPSGSQMSGSGPSGSSTGGTEGSSASLSDYGSTVLDTSHLSNATIDVDSSDLANTLYGNNSYCILTPESEVGPYFVGGELVRKDIVDDEPGVPLTIEAQFIDIDTCEPIEDLYWEVWHCNSTGVYSGVVANGNGNTDDQSNLDNTALRGIQKTDSDGIAGFDTVFPGHYTGRTTHFHVLTNIGATLLSNNTLSGGTIAHEGQFFFDQDLIDDIEGTVSPYTENTQEVTKNEDDRVFADATVTTGADPVFTYVKLGDDYSNGLFAWIVAGVDTSASYTASEAAHYYESGGVASSGSTGGSSGGQGGPGGSSNSTSSSGSDSASSGSGSSSGSGTTTASTATSGSDAGATDTSDSAATSTSTTTTTTSTSETGMSSSGGASSSGGGAVIGQNSGSSRSGSGAGSGSRSQSTGTKSTSTRGGGGGASRTGSGASRSGKATSSSSSSYMRFESRPSGGAVGPPGVMGEKGSGHGVVATRSRSGSGTASESGARQSACGSSS